MGKQVILSTKVVLPDDALADLADWLDKELEVYVSLEDARRSVPVFVEALERCGYRVVAADDFEA